MPLSRDSAGLTTSSQIFATGTNTANIFRTRIFTGWSNPGQTYLDLNINVNASAAGSGDAAEQSCIKYSINGGVSYTTLLCDSGTGYAQQTSTIALSATQDLTKLRVAVCVSGQRGNIQQDIAPGTSQVSIFDIWTSGSTTPNTGGNGSSTGQAHRGIVIVN